ncbi:MAG: shikimate kinase [Alphaproteobacteria bacterium]
MPSAYRLTLPRALVLVGLMGAGKTAIGRRLAARLGLPFADADLEVERAAGATIEDIFDMYGEPAFRDVERRVIARLLKGDVRIVSTGGGAFMDIDTRAVIAERGISLWLRADLELLLTRTARRNNRPLLKRGDPREILGQLIAERYPVYARADITLDSGDGPPEETVDAALVEIAAHLRSDADPSDRDARSV